MAAFCLPDTFPQLAGRAIARISHIILEVFVGLHL